MTKKPELDDALHRLGLNVPAREVIEISKAVKLIEEMTKAVRKARVFAAEPAHTVKFPESMQRQIQEKANDS